MDSIYNEQNIVNEFDKNNNITTPPYKPVYEEEHKENIPLYTPEFECNIREMGNYIEKYKKLLKSRANNCI